MIFPSEVSYRNFLLANGQVGGVPLQGADHVLTLLELKPLFLHGLLQLGDQFFLGHRLSRREGSRRQRQVLGRVLWIDVEEVLSRFAR